MIPPLVSIVTPSFNQARFLPATLRSVREQNYAPIEHIVMDGASTDGTVAILENDSDIRWISAPDRGQVDALNKGFAMAKGDILGWLNADDTLFPETVRTAVQALERTGADLVYGDLEIVDAGDRRLRAYRGIPFDLHVLLYGTDYIGQQTVFFRRSLLDASGPLREEFDNSFDYELWLRMSRHGRLQYVPGLRARIRHHATAKSIARAGVTAENNDRLRAEYWHLGEWPALFQRRPWFFVPHLLYRLKRQWRLRCRKKCVRPNADSL